MECERKGQRRKMQVCNECKEKGARSEMQFRKRYRKSKEIRRRKEMQEIGVWGGECTKESSGAAKSKKGRKFATRKGRGEECKKSKRKKSKECNKEGKSKEGSSSVQGMRGENCEGENASLQEGQGKQKGMYVNAKNCIARRVKEHNKENKEWECKCTRNARGNSQGGVHTHQVADTFQLLQQACEEDWLSTRDPPPPISLVWLKGAPAGVTSPFLVGCHCAANSGARLARLLSLVMLLIARNKPVLLGSGEADAVMQRWDSDST
jgi:hypothetical protein